MSSEKKEAIKQRLTATREEFRRAVEGLTDEQWNAPAYSEEGSEWRVLDLLRHVTDSERGMTAMMVQVRAGGEGVPPDFDLTRWNRRVVSKLQDKTAADLLADMETNRAALFALIDSLEDEDWDKKGRHASGHIMTIEQVCKLIARHERDHLNEIRAALANNGS
jgi:uncharacterized protein (TIGR03083 family)